MSDITPNWIRDTAAAQLTVTLETIIDEILESPACNSSTPEFIADELIAANNYLNTLHQNIVLRIERKRAVKAAPHDT